MRSYLLGTLEPDSAEMIEERYFTDRNFFLFMQAVETALIEDYLAGRLAPLPKRLFEERYLKVPELRRRLDEVRFGDARIEVPRAIQLNAGMLLAVVLLCICGLTFWMYKTRLMVEPLPHAGLDRPVLATFTLTPGITKAGTGEMVRVPQASGKGDIQFILDLPGGGAPRVCFARLSVFRSGSTPKEMFSTSRPVWPSKVPTGQSFTLLAPASLLQPGDYLAQILGPDDQIIESYLFRVVRR
jgi:hypothetical protein